MKQVVVRMVYNPPNEINDKYREKFKKLQEEYYKEIDKAMQKDETLYVNHVHFCDFVLMEPLTAQSRFGKKMCKEACKEYLESIGKKYDKNLNYCDYCEHMRYAVLDKDNKILFVSIDDD